MKLTIQIRRCVQIVLLSFLGFLFITGCTGSEIRQVDDEVQQVQTNVADVAQAVGDVLYGPDELLNLIKAVQAGNTASAPFNPYAWPIGAGLAGIIAMIEALRRKEKSGRQYAEQKLSNGNNNNGK